MNSLQQIIQSISALGQRQKMILAAAVLGAALVVILGIGAVNTPDYLSLYRNLTPTNAARIDTALISAGFDTMVSEDGKTISVRRSDLARARMVLAETGLPIRGDAGWELFDENSGWAMNSFLQRINRLRAMEGELARSIQTLDGVQSARVHLVLPQREAFSRAAPSPRASVIVRAIPGRAIDRKQAIAIRNLVASAVAELDLNRVTVLSATGTVILAEGGSGTGQVTLQTTKAAIEDRLVREIEGILTARVGAGNARVTVNVDLTTTREVIVQQSFDPDQQVVRSTQVRLEERMDSDNAGQVGVENNIPSALAATGDAATNSALTKSGEEVRYEIGNTRREITREAGEIKRISAAVLVNGIFTVDGSDVVYSERDSSEMARLTEIIKTAVGYDLSRGDTVSVDSFRFMDYSMEVGQPVSLSFSQQISNNIGSILRGLIALMIVAAALMFGLRPTLRYLSESQAIALQADAATQVLPADDVVSAGSSDPAVLRRDGTARSRVGGLPDPGQNRLDPQILGDDDSGGYIEAAGVRGRLMRTRVEAIQNVAAEKPDEALRVLRSWLSAEVTS